MFTESRILVVEDFSPLAEVLALHLAAVGHEVDVAEDGLTALRAFEDRNPALVTLDLQIPAISGFRLLQLFKRSRPEVPVIVVTALDFQEAEEVARAGADDFITKPFDPSAFLVAVDYHLRRRDSSRARVRARNVANTASVTLPPYRDAVRPNLLISAGR